MNLLILKKDKLFPFLKPYLPDNPVIVEAGAFNGTDTKRIAQFWPHGEIHAFEPVPDIFELLTCNTSEIPNVKRYNVALSSTVGTAQFYVSENPSAPGKPFPAGSLHQPDKRLAWSNAQYNATITVPTTTLDAWARQQGINKIDFLWLDVQGHALPILHASPQILAHTTAMLIEVEFISAYKNQALYHEVKNWITHHGFTLVATDFTDETSWFFGNALFLKTDCLL